MPFVTQQDGPDLFSHKFDRKFVETECWSRSYSEKIGITDLKDYWVDWIYGIDLRDLNNLQEACDLIANYKHKQHIIETAITIGVSSAIIAAIVIIIACMIKNRRRIARAWREVLVELMSIGHDIKLKAYRKRFSAEDYFDELNKEAIARHRTRSGKSVQK